MKKKVWLKDFYVLSVRGSWVNKAGEIEICKNYRQIFV